LKALVKVEISGVEGNSNTTRVPCLDKSGGMPWRERKDAKWMSKMGTLTLPFVCFISHSPLHWIQAIPACKIINRKRGWNRDMGIAGK
jgi:hypothetical protein